MSKYSDLLLEARRLHKTDNSIDALEKILDAVENDSSADQELRPFYTQILESLVTAYGYKSLGEDATAISSEQAKLTVQSLSRGKAVWRFAEKVRGKFNLIDVGPGTYWLPLGLEAMQYDFRYIPVTMNDQVLHRMMREKKLKPFERALPTLPSCLVAFEIIEHLMNPIELMIDGVQANNGKLPEFVMVSTPDGCFDPVKEKTGPKAQPHLRTYSADSLRRQLEYFFFPYDWSVETGPEKLLLAHGHLKAVSMQQPFAL